MDICIRDASLSDYDGISKLHSQIHELHVKHRPDLYQSTPHTFDYGYFKTLLTDDAYKVFVAEHLTIVAYTILRVEHTPNIPILVPRRTLNMNDICVDEGLRGRGIGRAIFEKVQDYAKSIGAGSLELNVLAFNEDAIEFYRSLNMKIKSIRMELGIQ